MTLAELFELNLEWDNDTFVFLYFSDGHSSSSVYRRIKDIKEDDWLKSFLNHKVEFFKGNNIAIRDEHGKSCGLKIENYHFS